MGARAIFNSVKSVERKWAEVGERRGGSLQQQKINVSGALKFYGGPEARECGVYLLTESK